MSFSSFGIVDLISKAALIFTAGYLAKALTPSLYGVWALLLGLQLLVSNLICFDFSTSLARFAANASPKDRKIYVWGCVAITGITSLIAFLVFQGFGPYILNLYNIQNRFLVLLQVIPFLAFIIALENIIAAYCKVKESISHYSFFISYKTFLEVGLLLFMFKDVGSLTEQEKIQVLLKYVYLQVFLKALFYAFLIQLKGTKETQTLNSAEGFSKDKISFIALTRYGLPAVIGSLVIWGFGNFDKAILAHHMSKDDLGIYIFGASLASYLTYLGGVAYPLLMPQVCRLFDQGRSVREISNKFNASFLQCLIIASSIWFVIALFHKEILLFTAGKSYLESALPFMILSLMFGFDQTVGMWAFSYHLKKKPGLLTIFRVGYFFVFLGTIFLHLKFLEPRLLPLSLFAINIVYNIFLYSISQKLISIKIALSNIVLMVLSLVISIGLYNLAFDLNFFMRALIFCFCVGLGFIFLLNYRLTLHVRFSFKN